MEKKRGQKYVVEESTVIGKVKILFIQDYRASQTMTNDLGVQVRLFSKDWLPYPPAESGEQRGAG
jgi:hypothetical protein